MRVQRLYDGWWYLPRGSSVWQYGGSTKKTAIESARRRMLMDEGEEVLDVTVTPGTE